MLKVKSILLQLCRKRKELYVTNAQAEVEQEMSSFQKNLQQNNTNKLIMDDLTAPEGEIIRYCQANTFSTEPIALKHGQVIK